MFMLHGENAYGVAALLGGTLDIESKRWRWLIWSGEVELRSCQGQKVSAVRGDEPVTFWQRIHDCSKHLLVAGGLQRE